MFKSNANSEWQRLLGEIYRHKKVKNIYRELLFLFTFMAFLFCKLQQISLLWIPDMFLIRGE